MLQLIDWEELRLADNFVFWRKLSVTTLSWIHPARREKEGAYWLGGLGIPYFFMRR